MAVFHSVIQKESCVLFISRIVDHLLHFWLDPLFAVFQTFQRGSNANKCHIFGKILRWASNMKKHIQEMHQLIRQFSCTVCGKGFSRQQNLQGHMASVHNYRKEFICSICGNEYGYKCLLKQHMKNSHSTSW